MGRFFHGYYDCHCYLPLYIFCGRHLLAARLRRSNIDGAAGAIEEVDTHCRADPGRRRLEAYVFWLRGDPGFAREALMAWCEANRVNFLFGLARNERLEQAISTELMLAKFDSLRTGRLQGPTLQGLHLVDAGQLEAVPPRAASAKPRSRAVMPTPASSSPRSSRARLPRNTSTRRSIARVAKRKTASRNARLIDNIHSPTAPRLPLRARQPAPIVVRVHGL